MSSNITVLITGASRGIGSGLVAAYLNLPSTTVVAAVRKTASAESLHLLPKALGSRLVVIEVDVASVDTIKHGIASLRSEHNIDSLDIVLANAGDASLSPKAAESEISDIQPFINVNAYGQLELYKAVAPLLRASKSEKGRFMYMSSVAGSLTSMNTIVDLSAYGASKAFANFLFRWLSFEQEDIIVWAQHPGIVATEKAKVAFEDLKLKGIDIAPLAVSVEQSCNDILQIVANATLEKTHGKFLGPDSVELPW
ncbi:aflatoxin biosynthesis ketoreductase nor-1 [Pyrenochaeta sp. DS3sAY3a]|nr:aflatoxin biosynthesis ketoreductase nor-1 [Pyrenochaeta sp. DS3sAY3a]